MMKKSYIAWWFLIVPFSILPQKYDLDEHTIALWHLNENRGSAIIDEVRISNIARVPTKTGELYDLFPIAIGNRYVYNYQFIDTAYYLGGYEYIQNDTGKISYAIIDSTIINNGVDWSVEQKIDLIRKITTNYEMDTLYSVKNTTNFILTESLNGNHELVANPAIGDDTGYWGKKGIWRFPVSKLNPIYRYRETPVYNISSSIPGHSVDSLWFDTRGLYKRTYISLYYGNHYEFTHTKASLDSVFVDVSNYYSNIPEDFYLFQNYPNPFNPSTTIQYSIPERSNVVINVYDILGGEVAKLVNEEKPAGNYNVEFNGSNLTSGIYFFRLQAGDYVDTKKMILLK